MAAQGIELVLPQNPFARWQADEGQEMIGGICALFNQAALPDPPPPLASHQRRRLLFQKFCELASLCLSADESVHVDLVPVKSESNWAPNPHIVNLVPEILENFQALNPHFVDLVPKEFGSNWARDRHVVNLVPEKIMASVADARRRGGWHQA